ncbi:MAG: HAMP domain-containing histidine kinase [Clostridia bacterium]|nr:HAMP domain-containing histidine kinase [bacterium]MBR4110223.1 HAMP domain-containing histidine kinase [Clostridia bacterium]
MKNKFSTILKKNIQLYTILVYGLVLLLGVLSAYYFLPVLLNYAPDTINTEFDRQFSSGFTYFMQFAVIYVVLFFLESMWLIHIMKDFYGLDTIVKNAKKDAQEKERLNRIIKKSLTIPRTSFTFIALIPTAIVGIAFMLLGFTSFADLKVLIVLITLSMLAGTLTYIASKSIFKSILTNLDNRVLFKGTRTALVPTIMFQILPIALVCILYTFLLSYSSALEDKSIVMQHHYVDTITEDIEKNNISSLEQLEDFLSNIKFITNKDKAFYINSNNEFVNFAEQEVSEFFIQYALTLSGKHENRVYDYYGSEIQGTLIPVKIGTDDIKIVIQYDLSGTNLPTIFFNVVILLLISSIVIYNFASSISKDISLVTTSINKLINSKNDGLEGKLPVTSSDELGDLLLAFNKVQELTKSNIAAIQNNQNMLIEKERLASLGQMIGGIAHNMKTPIMSIAGASEGLTELVAEYVASIDNPSVTSEDHKEIAKDMLDWITKIKTHTSYMSDIITTVKGQAAQLNSTGNETFTLYDLSKRVDILIKHEIKKALLTLDISIDCNPTISLNGDINNLIQVINNLITNSIHAYEGKPNEVIKFNISADDNNVYFKVSDNGCGMKKETQEKLFKEMYTTKGKNGTGLGLYMSYSTIKGNFNGTIDFTSEEGKGTTFTISIPVEK